MARHETETEQAQMQCKTETESECDGLKKGGGSAIMAAIMDTVEYRMVRYGTTRWSVRGDKSVPDGPSRTDPRVLPRTGESNRVLYFVRQSVNPNCDCFGRKIHTMQSLS